MTSKDQSSPTNSASAISRLLDRPSVPAMVATDTKAAAEGRVLRREPQVNLLLFRCGGEWFGVPADAVVHVSRATPVHAIPHRSGDALRGITAISGAIVVVFDLCALLGIPPSPQGVASATQGDTGKSRMISIGTSTEQWAFQADEVPGVFVVAKTAIKPLPVTVEQSPRRISSGLVATTHGPTTLVDSERLLAEFKEAIG